MDQRISIVNNIIVYIDKIYLFINSSSRIGLLAGAPSFAYFAKGGKPRTADPLPKASAWTASPCR